MKNKIVIKCNEYQRKVMLSYFREVGFCPFGECLCDDDIYENFEDSKMCEECHSRNILFILK